MASLNRTLISEGFCSKETSLKAVILLEGSICSQGATYDYIWITMEHVLKPESTFSVVECQFLSYAPSILYWCVSAMASRQILLWRANVLPAHIRHCEQDSSFTLLVLLRCFIGSGFMQLSDDEHDKMKQKLSDVIVLRCGLTLILWNLRELQKIHFFTL